MTRKVPDLDSAYSLKTPDDSRAFYADWAQTYDGGFAEEMDYQLPRRVAEVIATLGISRPVLDAGAGTGLLAGQMTGDMPIDALDISAEMLAVAMEKRLYRRAIEADLTKPLPLANGVYGAVVSSGTFTHGHVGPDALDELLRVARPGAHLVLAINGEHYVAKGFEAKFSELETEIDGLTLHDVAIYGDRADAAHRDDRAVIVSFTKR